MFTYLDHDVRLKDSYFIKLKSYDKRVANGIVE